MKSIKQLQSIVNEISNSLDGIDNREKLVKAHIMVNEKSQELIDILHLAIDERYQKDVDSAIRVVLGMK